MNRSVAHSARRVAQRGVTLVEVMIVVVILGLISAGVAFAVFPQLKKGQVQTTEVSMRTLRLAAETWRGSHSDECPTPQRLQQDKIVDPSTKMSDAWGTTFKIICDDDNTIIFSPGPDKKEGNDDDLRIGGAASSDTK